MAICTYKTENGVTLTLCCEEAEALLLALKRFEMDKESEDLQSVYECLSSAIK